jgi:hypothetical protein
VESLGLTLRYTYLAAPLLLLAAYGALVRWAARPLIQPGLLALSLMACFAVLLGMWQAGLSDGGTIAGLLPFSDAHGYYSDALRLLHGQRFSDFSARRPAAPAFLAVVLFVTGGDLRLALALLTALVAMAIWMACREVHETFGPWAGALLFLCLFLFYRRFIGTCLTEHLGLALGCLAFALVWRGGRCGRVGPVLWGLGLLSLALNARAGAFFVLPCLLLWAMRVFGRSSGRALVATGGAAAIASGFLVSRFLLHSIATPRAAFSNFAYTLYGLVHGGDWSLALRQHPQLAALPMLEQSNAVYALAWEQMLSHPFSLMSGAARAWAAFFCGVSGSWSSHVLDLLPHWREVRDVVTMEGFAALNLSRDGWVLVDAFVYHLSFVLLNVLLVAGAAVATRTASSALVRLGIWSGLGILLSVPFAPPWDADNMRAYAATLPLLLVFPLLGTCYRRAGTGIPDARRTPRAAWRVAPGMLGVMVVVGVMAAPLVQGSQARAGHLSRRLLLVDPRNAVHLTGEAGRTANLNGNAIRVDLLTRRRLRPYPPVWQMAVGVVGVPPGTTVGIAFNLRDGRADHIQSRTAVFPTHAALLEPCGIRPVRGRLHVEAWDCGAP